jgi:hypothetical protein
VKLTTEQLIQQLSRTLDLANVRDVVESYVEMEQRFRAGDWGPAELDAGRLCEAAGRLTRADLCSYAATQKRQTVQTAITRLIKEKDVRPTENGEVAITPAGQRRVMEVVLPKCSPMPRSA